MLVRIYGISITLLCCWRFRIFLPLVGFGLPFKGFENKEPLPQSPLTEIMQSDFVLFDLGLYLDTHPDDEVARTFYNHRLQASRQKREEYVKNSGPLSKSDGLQSGDSWILGPWPWE